MSDVPRRASRWSLALGVVFLSLGCGRIDFEPIGEDAAADSEPPPADAECTQAGLCAPDDCLPPPPPIPGTARITAGQVALYDLSNGAGDTVPDGSGAAEPLDLTIADTDAVTWSATGLSIDAPTIIQSAGPATAVIDAIRASRALTVEAWVTPSTTDSGTAPMVTVSADEANRNVALTQGIVGRAGPVVGALLRADGTGPEGEPLISACSLTTTLTHLLYTRDASGVARIYINGTSAGATRVDGDLGSWDGRYPLALANEPNRALPWLGELHLVAIFARALAPDEIQRQLEAGPPTEAPDPS